MKGRNKEDKVVEKANTVNKGFGGSLGARRDRWRSRRYSRDESGLEKGPTNNSHNKIVVPLESCTGREKTSKIYVLVCGQQIRFSSRNKMKRRFLVLYAPTLFSVYFAVAAIFQL